MAFACGMMFPFVLQASLIQSYMPLPLSMGVTRRGFFAGAQAAKVMLAGGIGVCLLLIQLAVKWMFGVDACSPVRCWWGCLPVAAPRRVRW